MPLFRCQVKVEKSLLGTVVRVLGTEKGGLGRHESFNLKFDKDSEKAEWIERMQV